MIRRRRVLYIWLAWFIVFKIFTGDSCLLEQTYLLELALNQGGITWSYEEMNSLVFLLCNVYTCKEFNSLYDHVI